MEELKNQQMVMERKGESKPMKYMGKNIKENTFTEMRQTQLKVFLRGMR